MKISIIGSGFVGVALGKGLIDLGNGVIFYDVVNKNLPNFTTDITYAIGSSNISFVCVPTPTNDKGEIDLSYIKEASKNVGKAIAKKANYHLVVIKSTVVPTTTENVVIPILENYSEKKAGEFGVCMNPEFLTEISNTWSDDEGYKKDLYTEDRIVIGEYDKKSSYSSSRIGDEISACYKVDAKGDVTNHRYAHHSICCRRSNCLRNRGYPNYHR